MRRQPPNLPFESGKPTLPWVNSDDGSADLARHNQWLDALKDIARHNAQDDFQRLRIAWQIRFGVPRHSHFDDYAPEELIVEMWEIYYFENPNDLALKGIHKKVNPKTGYSYYETGDPIIDALEKQFSTGETPDLAEAFAGIKHGPSIWKAAAFTDKDGNTISAQRSASVQPEAKTEKMPDATSHSTDFTSDAWLKDAFAEDATLKAMAERMGITDAEQ